MFRVIFCFYGGLFLERQCLIPNLKNKAAIENSTIEKYSKLSQKIMDQY